MKTLSVYASNSVFRYPSLFHDFNYTCEDDKILRVFERAVTTGEEWEHAVFKEWSYYIIEGDNE